MLDLGSGLTETPYLMARPAIVSSFVTWKYAVPWPTAHCCSVFKYGYEKGNAFDFEGAVGA